MEPTKELGLLSNSKENHQSSNRSSLSSSNSAVANQRNPTETEFQDFNGPLENVLFDPFDSTQPTTSFPYQVSLASSSTPFETPSQYVNEKVEKIIEEAKTAQSALTFESIAKKETRVFISLAFHKILAMKSENRIDVQQDVPYGSIAIIPL